MSEKAKKITKIVVDVLFWIFFVIALLFTILAFASQSSTRGYPKLGDTALFSIQSPSMENSTFKDGGFNKGDLIICKVLSEDDKNNLKEGDVITYYWDIIGNDGVLEANSHRITEVHYKADGVTLESVQTKGDNNTNLDDYVVTADRIECVWTGKKVPGLGAVITFLQQPYGFWPVVIAPLAVFLGYEVVVLVKSVNEIKNKDKRVISKADEELIKQQAIEEFLKKQEAEKNAASSEEAPKE